MKRCLLALILMGVVSVGYGVVIGDFEDSSLDGFIGNDGATVSQSGGTGAVSGVDALQITDDAPGWSYAASKQDGNVFAPLQGPRSGAKVIAHITFVASEWSAVEIGTGDPAPEGTIWAQFNKIAIQGDGLGWTEFPVTYDSSRTSYLGNWDPYYWGEVYTTMLIWDVSSVDWNNLPTAPGWTQIFFSVNCGLSDDTVYEWESQGNYYMDYIRLIPEPASLMMLGLGSVALLRRKK